MQRDLKIRLSIMMFLQYLINGSFLPILSHYLKNYLGFTPFQTGVVLAMPALAAILAPFVIVRVADRAIRAERLLALTQFLSAILMGLLYFQKSFYPFLVLYFVHGLLFVPSFALTNTIAFHHVTDAKRDFGGLRRWGPAAWVIIGWTFGYLYLRGGSTGLENERLPHALAFSAIASALLAAYALTLPRAEAVTGARPAQLARAGALAVFLRPSLLLLCILTFFNALVHQLYYYGMSPYMSQVGFGDQYIMPAMSLGQLGEMVVLGSLGWFLLRISVKRALIIGSLAQAVRTIAFATGSKFLTVLVIPLHGVCYAFFFTVAYIYVDTHSSAHNRAGTQQVFNILLAGFGNLAGNLVAGKVAQYYADPVTQQINFTGFWVVSTVMAFAITLALALFFREEKPSAFEAK